MENHQQGGGTSPTLRGTSVRQGRPDDNPLEESRNRICVLAKKTGTLCPGCRADQEKTMHIRLMGSTLAVLTALVSKLGWNSRTMHTTEILEDARGFTYRSVRSCDLDRFSDK